MKPFLPLWYDVSEYLSPSPPLPTLIRNVLAGIVRFCKNITPPAPPPAPGIELVEL